MGALLFAFSTLEEQAVFLLAPEYQQTHGQGGRKRKTSSSSSSLYSVNEEEEFRAEVFSTSAATASASSSSSPSASTPRRLFRVTPHYGQSQQLGAARKRASNRSNATGKIWSRKKEEAALLEGTEFRASLSALTTTGSVARSRGNPIVIQL